MNVFDFLYMGLIGLFGITAFVVLTIFFVIASFAFVLFLTLFLFANSLSPKETIDLTKTNPKKEEDRYLRLMILSFIGFAVAFLMGLQVAWMFLAVSVALLILFSEKAEQTKEKEEE